MCAEMGGSPSKSRFGGSARRRGGGPPDQPWPEAQWTNGSWPSTTTNHTMLKLMAPGHFCPDVCGLEDFGPADHLRGRVVRAFFHLMRLWPVTSPLEALYARLDAAVRLPAR